MNIESLLMMRHELLLVLVVMLILIVEIFTPDHKKEQIIPIAVILFGITVGLGFLPIEKGTLFGGMYHSDGLRVMMKNILNIGVFIVFLQSIDWLRKHDNLNKISEYFMMLLATLIGMNYMISSGDFLMLYLGLETATIPLAALAAYDRYKSQSAEAGIKLILSSALSSGVLLYGVSLIYGTTGSIYFDKVALTFTGNSLQVLAFIFFFAGMAFKISIVPFHLWTADVYEGSPIGVTSYLSVISKGAAIFIFMIVLFTVFKSIAKMWVDVLYATAVLTMTIGNLFALRQTNLKRFLAFSSISQAGFLFLGIIGGTSETGSELGMAAVIYFALIYIFSNLAAFGVISIISNVTGKENIEDYNGLYRTNPKLSLVMMLALFSLAGIPPVAGFFGKFFLFTAAAQAGYYILVLLAVLNTTISLYYYLLVIKAMFLNKSEMPIEYIKSNYYTRIALLVCVAGLIITGFASSIFEWIRQLSFGI